MIAYSNKDPEYFLNRIKQDLRAYQDSVKVALCDIQESKDKNVIYIFDFDGVFPYIWNDAPGNTPTYKDYGRRIVSNLVENRNVGIGFTGVFTGPSFIELMDSFLHHIEELEEKKRNYSTTKDKIDQLLKAEFTDVRQLCITSGLAEKELATLIAIADSTSGLIDQYVQRAKTIIGVDGIFKGLGEINDLKFEISNKDRTGFDVLLQRMIERRSHRDSREKKHKEFHYKIDCANILATSVAARNNSNRSIKMVSGLNMGNHSRTDLLRHPLVPNLWVSSHVLHQIRRAPNPHQFLTYALGEIQGILGLLDSVAADKQLTDFHVARIEQFYKDIGRPLNSPVAGRNITEGLRDRIAILSSRDEFERRLESTTQDVLQGAKELAQIRSFMLEDDLLAIPQLDEDPVMNDIIRKFFI